LHLDWDTNLRTTCVREHKFRGTTASAPLCAAEYHVHSSKTFKSQDDQDFPRDTQDLAYNHEAHSSWTTPQQEWETSHGSEFTVWASTHRKLPLTTATIRRQQPRGVTPQYPAQDGRAVWVKGNGRWSACSRPTLLWFGDLKARHPVQGREGRRLLTSHPTLLLILFSFLSSTLLNVKLITSWRS
jgi:hypothetical protein